MKTESADELTRLREKAMLYEQLFEMSDDAILVIENERFVDCNQAVVKMLGYEQKSQLLNTHPSELSPERQPDGQLSYEKAEKMMELAVKNGSHHFEWIHTRANGENFPVEVWLSTLRHNGKLLINTIWRDMTEIKFKEAKIQASLKEKEALLKEIHHRVKNNMQVITSLLNLQLGLIDDAKIRDLFRQSQFRINSMALTHEMLYQTENISKINYSDYLNRLISGIIMSLSGIDSRIRSVIDAPDLLLNIDTAVPLGLMITEIITNSIKYAFTGIEDPVITVHMQESGEGQYLLEIGDNGRGMPEEQDTDD